MEKERDRIIGLSLFGDFLRVVTVLRDFNKIEEMNLEGELEVIAERGAMARLKEYQDKTGYEPSVAVVELAKSGDKLGQ